MKLLLLLSILASALHLSIAVAVERRAGIFARGMRAWAYCAGRDSPVVCSVPSDPTQDKTYRQFVQSKIFIDRVADWRKDYLVEFGNNESMYGLYQQGSIGDVNIEQPWAMLMVARSKWDAWYRLEGMPCDEARSQYVKQALVFVDSMDQKIIEQYGKPIVNA
ncbi:BZ3500_MvSof-1268-A1-R1_Chr9g10823 [Microbotryum saponariae]|uniref:BZ3500_MvSof-1268-A1-R1_Chr9g10823 protein n=1 Tax=Microbotryum saponariae TaxID=289078 RepID=A0A2X0M8Q2_9BASI|nr:BZ3501_MvSof-1269-A2-R1_Chr9g10571 [Microbotryum saponariae]SDA00757.1 BZ3500_MvSof-1268-A1-R1_Chr9g10823 [Microbotryum saponariae]